MIATVLFTAVVAMLVFLAGRTDQARDPRLTVFSLILLTLFPLLLGFLPKVEVLPAPEVSESAKVFPWMNLLLCLWVAGFCIAGIRLALAAKGISNWRKRSSLLERIDGVEIRELSGIKSPVAAGVLRPVVFVPERWNQWPAERQQVVLDHELAHHRRRDPLWRWIAEIACAVHCYNPLVIWMSRRLTLQCEFACDALVLQNGVPATDYARVLCDCAETSAMRGPVMAMAESSSLESRVIRLIKPVRPMGSVGLISLIFLTVALAGVFASLAPERKAATPISKQEVELRWSANPFPGENE
jgi:beta-lactamase regulating signal transducer with metallopeptidase domain